MLDAYSQQHNAGKLKSIGNGLSRKYRNAASSPWAHHQHQHNINRAVARRWTLPVMLWNKSKAYGPRLSCKKLLATVLTQNKELITQKRLFRRYLPQGFGKERYSTKQWKQCKAGSRRKYVVALIQVRGLLAAWQCSWTYLQSKVFSQLLKMLMFPHFVFLVSKHYSFEKTADSIVLCLFMAGQFGGVIVQFISSLNSKRLWKRGCLPVCLILCCKSWMKKISADIEWEQEERSFPLPARCMMWLKQFSKTVRFIITEINDDQKRKCWIVSAGS